MKKQFGVLATSFFLLEAFKKEAEKAGWKYNRLFNDFTETKFKNGSDLHFASHWNNEDDYMFSFSSTDDEKRKFILPNDWNEAVAFLQVEKWEGVNTEKIRIKE